ncbi:MAG: polysaccharide deacetylase family protein [Rhizobiaceae bacterium]
MIDRGELVRKLALNVARFTGLAPIARPWAGGLGAILMLHRVTVAPEKPMGLNRHLTVRPSFLDRLIADMKRKRYRFVSLDEAVDRIRAGKADERFATITADDGYRDNLTEALPVFEKHETPFTIYVAPGLINGTSDLWWDVVEDIVTARERFYVSTREGRVMVDCSNPARKLAAASSLHQYLTTDVSEEDQTSIVRALAVSVGVDPSAPRRSLMTWEEIRRIATHPLCTIGAHTVNHYNLRRLSLEKAWREVADAAGILRIETGETPRHFAYPYGYGSAVGEREVGIAREAGYLSAVTTRHGVLKAAHRDFLHALPRISINGRYQRVAHVRTMLSGLTTPLANAGKMVVTV